MKQHNKTLISAADELHFSKLLEVTRLEWLYALFGAIEVDLEHNEGGHAAKLANLGEYLTTDFSELSEADITAIDKGGK